MGGLLASLKRMVLKLVKDAAEHDVRELLLGTSYSSALLAGNPASTAETELASAVEPQKSTFSCRFSV